VRVTADSLAGVDFTGRVTALDSVVDQTTRNVQIQATLANPRGTLRPGMFVQAEVMLGATRSVVTLPASAISYAPYGDSVFVVTDLKGENGQTYRGVRQQVVLDLPAQPAVAAPTPHLDRGHRHRQQPLFDRGEDRVDLLLRVD
jgi:membrane fusion protein (multidrug efflux system)